MELDAREDEECCELSVDAYEFLRSLAMSASSQSLSTLHTSSHSALISALATNTSPGYLHMDDIATIFSIMPTPQVRHPWKRHNNKPQQPQQQQQQCQHVMRSIADFKLATIDLEHVVSSSFGSEEERSHCEIYRSSASCCDQIIIGDAKDVEMISSLLPSSEDGSAAVLSVERWLVQWQILANRKPSAVKVGILWYLLFSIDWIH